MCIRDRDMLRAGLPVRDKLIELNDGRKFVTTLQVNVEQRGVEFVPGTGKSPRTCLLYTSENGRGVQHPPARHRQPHNRQIPGTVRGRQDISRSAL